MHFYITKFVHYRVKEDTTAKKVVTIYIKGATFNEILVTR